MGGKNAWLRNGRICIEMKLEQQEENIIEKNKHIYDRYKALNKDRLNEIHRNWVYKNKEKVKIFQKESYLRNYEKNKYKYSQINYIIKKIMINYLKKDEKEKKLLI